MMHRAVILLILGAALVGCTIVPNAGTAVDSGDHPSKRVTSDMIEGVTDSVDLQLINDLHAQSFLIRTMAAEALANSRDREIRTQAAAIFQTQGVALRQMEAWRAEWFADAPALVTDAPAVGNSIAADDNKSFDLRFLDAIITQKEQMMQLANEANGKVAHTQLDTLVKSILIQQPNDISRLKGFQQQMMETSS